MNRDSTIIQVALFLIVIAILGVAILKQQTSDSYEDREIITPVKEAEIEDDDDDVLIIPVS